MLVWLASYPRSGSTYVRIVLNKAFALQTYSLHGAADERTFAARAGMLDLVGHRSGSAPGDALIEEARASDKIYFIKTHEPPLTDDPAIYIVRDGRSAIVSYFHYYNEVEKVPITLENVIKGNLYAGSWSDHFHSWNPLERKATLFLRFEDITRNTKLLVSLLSNFCNISSNQEYDPSFSNFNKIFPEFFRSGRDKDNIAEISPLLELFNERHGALMSRLHYS
jgi:hypothetical protein